MCCHTEWANVKLFLTHKGGNPSYRLRKLLDPAFIEIHTRTHTICIIRQMLQQGHIRFSVGQIQPLKWGRERNMSATKTEVFLNCCCFTYYIFLIFYMSDNFQIYHNSQWSFTYAPLFSESHWCIFRSQSWLLSVLLGRPLEGPPTFFFVQLAV